MSRTVQGLWIGRSLSLVERLSIKSFLANGSDFHLYTYEPIENVPDGTTLKDANEIVPQEDFFVSKKGGLAGFSDFFRWHLLDRRGGVWVDLDVVCLRPFDFGDDIVFGYEDENGSIGSSVIGFPAGHFLARAMREACDDVNKLQPFDDVKAAVKKFARSIIYGKKKSRAHTRYAEPGGPAYFTKQLQHYGMAELAKPKRWFFPLSLKDWRKIFEPGDYARNAVRDSYSVHMYNRIITDDGAIDKNVALSGETLFGELLRRYDVAATP